MSNPSRRRRREEQRRQMKALAAQPFALSQMFRSQCTDCGSSRLTWCHGRDFEKAGAPAAAAADIRAQMGPDFDAAECWICQSCGQVGAFGPSESSGF